MSLQNFTTPLSQFQVSMHLNMICWSNNPPLLMTEYN